MKSFLFLIFFWVLGAPAFSDQKKDYNGPVLLHLLQYNGPAVSLQYNGSVSLFKKPAFSDQKIPSGEELRGDLNILDALHTLIITHNGIKEKQGTGFFISPKLLVTAHHVIKGREESLENGLSEMLILGAKGHFNFKKIVDFSKEYDIALIEIERKGDQEIPYLKVSSKQPQEGQIVYTFGYAQGSLTRIRSKIVYIEKGGKYWSKIIGFETKRMNHIDKRVSGMSGGPVINDEGEIIGVYGKSVYSNPKLFGYQVFIRDYATSISHLKELLPGKEGCVGVFAGQSLKD